MLGLNFIILLHIVLAIISSIMAGYLKMADVRELLRDSMGRAVAAYDEEDEGWARNLMDTVQTVFPCCGGERASQDYLDNLDTIPQTCGLPYYGIPCPKAVFEVIADYFRKMAVMAVGVAAVLVLFMIFDFCLLFAIRKDRYHQCHNPQHGPTDNL